MDFISKNNEINSVSAQHLLACLRTKLGQVLHEQDVKLEATNALLEATRAERASLLAQLEDGSDVQAELQAKLVQVERKLMLVTAEGEIHHFAL